MGAVDSAHEGHISTIGWMEVELGFAAVGFWPGLGQKISGAAASTVGKFQAQAKKFWVWLLELWVNSGPGPKIFRCGC